LAVCVRIENALEKDAGDTIRVVQIKEKYGTLRIYWEGMLSERASADVDAAIDRAYARSACTCEICGGEGRDCWNFCARGRFRHSPTNLSPKTTAN
jgi:hypothetical protein